MYVRLSAAGVMALAISHAFANAALPETVVTATRLPTDVAKVNHDVTVIEAEAIQAAGAASLPELLSQQAGVQIARSGGAGTLPNLFVRGTSANRTVVLVDGVRVYGLDSGLSPLEHIPLAQIDRVEIVRGAMSGLYGADAIGGVIQVFTREGEGAMRPFVNIGVGSEGRFGASAGVSGKTGNTRYALTVSHDSTDGFSATNSQSPWSYNPDQDGYRNSSYSLKLSQQLTAQHEVGVQSAATRAHTDYDATADRTGRIHDYFNSAIRSNGVFWRAAFSPVWESTLRFDQAVSEVTNFDGAPSVRSFHARTQRNVWGWQNRIELGNAGRVVAGLDYAEESFDSQPRYAVTERVVKAAYLGYQNTLGAHRLEATVRHDDNAQFGSKTTGSASYGYALTTALSANVAAGTAFRAPAFLDLYYPGFSNPNLKPESATNLEAALRWREGVHRASLTVYRNRIEDMIQYNFAAGMPINIAHAKLQGLTLAGGTQLAGVGLTATLDWLTARDGDTDRVLPRRAARHAVLGAEKTWGTLTSGVELHAASRRFDDAANRVPLAGYGSANLWTRWQVARDWSALARVNNVFDRTIVEASGYNTAGRQWWLNLSWQPK